MPDNPADTHAPNHFPRLDHGVGVDTVTVLRAKKGKILTKRWTRFGQGPPQETTYDKATWFAATEYLVRNIRELGALIRRISAEPQAAIVRGAIAAGADRSHMLRRKHARGSVPASLVTTSRCWVGLDIEKVPCPLGIDPVFDPDQIVEHVIARLPPEFRGATCYWHFSSGHGIKPDIRIRLWFWLDRPVSDQELKRWFSLPIAQAGVPEEEWKAPPVDTSLFDPVQLHYTATPIFSGMTDPLPYRSGWRQGVADGVTAPELPVPEVCVYPTSSGHTLRSLCGMGPGYCGYRARIGDHPGGDGFWRPINSALGAYFGAGGSNADIEWVIDDLATVIRSRQCDRTDAYIENRLWDLPNAAAAIRGFQAASEAAQAERARLVTHFPGDPTGPLLLATRVEDAAAGCHATGFPGRACTAGLVEGALDDVPTDRIIVVLLPDVDRFLPARQATLKTIRRWQSDHRRVLQAVPRAQTKRDGYTFAELMQSAGPSAVKARIEAALTPIQLPKRLPVDEARQALRVTINRVFGELLSTAPAEA